MHQGLNATQYVACLQRMYGVVAAWEERVTAIAPEWMQNTLAARRRTDLLKRDLAWFGKTVQEDSRPRLPEMKDLPALLGAMYVMEGSTLGGQFIARHVEAALHLTEGQGDAYFRGHGNQTGPMWKEFCDILKTKVPDADTEAVVLSAKAMFAVFGSWMQEKSAMHG